jgi:hypothetical protein
VNRLRAKGVLAEVFYQRERQLGWMAFVVMFIFWVWVYQVRLLLALFLGFKSFSSWDAVCRDRFVDTGRLGVPDGRHPCRGVPGDGAVFNNGDRAADAGRAGS